MLLVDDVGGGKIERKCSGQQAGMAASGFNATPAVYSPRASRKNVIHKTRNTRRKARAAANVATHM